MLLLIIAVITAKVGKIAWRYKQNNDHMIYGLYEAYGMNNMITLDTSANHVLCIGNSITYHAPLKGDLPGADSLWRGDWGMCASRPELDYVHRIEARLKEYNQATIVDRTNLWAWEQNFDINIDSLIGSDCKDTNLIILKIGENVKADREDQFHDAFDSLTAYCLRYTPNVIIAGNYWKAPRKEQAMICVARKYRLPYVPLFWIYESYREQVVAHVGDTVYDVRMQPYPIATEFICTHPNDEGMRMIAEAIMGKIRVEN